MKSMTGYGYGEFSCENYLMTMELKSYNNRFLEVNYYAPPVLGAYENTLTALLKEKAQRGHIDVSIRLKTIKGTVDVAIDEELAKAYLNAFNALCSLEEAKNFPKATFSDLIAQEGVLSSFRTDALEFYKEGLDYCTKKVLEQFESEKLREGTVTCKDLEEKINSIEKSLAFVTSKVDELESLIKTNLESRIKEMLGDQNYDENRILTEVAVMLNRFTINEEVVRLGTHISEFRKLLKSTDPVGKKMDFLCQEMNREINTMGSKSQMVELNLEVVNMKDCLENIREQIRNIE
ncbi:MAG: YicC family protein [Sphaerochaetaceae bacterium]|nr:YicC family protein [Sphaerochaetaceae bacterium]